MSEQKRGGLPSLIVVTGRPASGKTTLSRLLADALGATVVSRDAIMEDLLRSIDRGASVEGDPKHHAYRRFFDTIERHLRDQTTLIAEAAFQHPLWAPRLEPLTTLATIRVIRCTLDPKLAQHRFAQRAKAGAALPHVHAIDPGNLRRTHEPLHLNVPTLDVDTSDGYRPGLRDIMTFARSGQ